MKISPISVSNFKNYRQNSINSNRNNQNVSFRGTIDMNLLFHDWSSSERRYWSCTNIGNSSEAYPINPKDYGVEQKGDNIKIDTDYVNHIRPSSSCYGGNGAYICIDNKNGSHLFLEIPYGSSSKLNELLSKVSGTDKTVHYEGPTADEMQTMRSQASHRFYADCMEDEDD